LESDEHHEGLGGVEVILLAIVGAFVLRVLAEVVALVMG